ncbi:GlsB/YeaQ/YmgE family stress response membrane protein [Microbulbifer sp. OS29]|uniref:GlsB/YeaQ/YmgE family stress response membrane protein n=1 Tax=Microbulbifer okhotskensis TaxID=2926617 RepID=A0A9X2EKS0_9GAMM|nr:GlsB/YeaQ/YmgE family stress response membrane protein [Microbulbifer okhotskensis]MCO1332840.1 GlsB/YeaQ/YmgE family stress response membrane protein [Microbulbifer okhotskensis]
MGVLSWVILGLIAGALAKWIMPGRDPGGWIVTMVIGIVGAFIGGWLGALVGLGGPVTGFGIGDIITATIGAVIFLAIYRMFKRRGN